MHSGCIAIASIACLVSGSLSKGQQTILPERQLPLCVDTISVTETQIRAAITRAEAGDSQAQCVVGIAYLEGLFLPSDPTASFHWLSSSASAGLSVAEAYLAYLYEHGLGVTRSEGEAVKWYEKSAAQGEAVAQNNLGTMYLNGRGGLPQSYEQAAIWFQKSAAQGSESARVNLGLLYRAGRGVVRNYAKAFQLLRPSAERGNGIAQAAVGWMYLNAEGATPDYAEAMKWIRSAAEKGVPEAHEYLATMYERGLGTTANQEEAQKWSCLAAREGIPSAQNTVGYEFVTAEKRDYKMAARWFQKAADQGEPTAQVNLATLYAEGKGVHLDYVQSFFWLSLATASGDEHAKVYIQRLREIMTPKQIEMAESLVSKQAIHLKAAQPPSDSMPNSADPCPAAAPKQTSETQPLQ